jgi:hypothetical protein
MPLRGLPADTDLDALEELDEKLQRPACSTATSGKLLQMPKRSPDDSCRASARILRLHAPNHAKIPTR